MEHMKCILHMKDCSPSPTLYILIHSCRNPLQWKVVLLEVVANNHQVDLASLLLLEGLGTSSRVGRRLILGLWEGREEDLGPWYKEEMKGGQDRMIGEQTVSIDRINRESDNCTINGEIASVNGEVMRKSRIGKLNIGSEIIPNNVKITRKILIRWRNRPW